MQHFLNISDLSSGALRALLDDAHSRKARRAQTPRPVGARDDDAPLADKLLAMIFDKPSTRTRLSFDVAMRQLGGQVIILNRSDAQFGRGETFADTAQIVSRLADIAMFRTGAHSNIEEFAAAASIPVINGLSDASHPCQIIADLMTFEEHKGRLDGQRLAWIGDGNNVAASFIDAAVLLDFELAVACPHGYQLDADYIAQAQKAGAKITLCDTPAAAAEGASAVITDCWLSMGDDPASKETRLAALAPYQITPALMAKTDAAIFMHCLPAYRGQEVDAAVIDGAASVVFDEAENRCHAQKAILTSLFGGRD